jgi:peptidoglycan-associated lipoprotein
MFLKSSLLLSVVIASVSFNSCTDDKKKVVEPVAPVVETPAAPTAAETTVNLVTTPIYFGFDDYTLTSEAQSTLTAMSEGLKSNKSAVVQIEGHCDERGTVEYNLALGERRAQSVKNFLTQLSVEGARLSTISYGEEKAVVPGHTEAEWVKNRRAEFVVTKN